MKKSIICLLIFVLTFLFTEYAQAAVYNCEYLYNNVTVTIEYDTENDTFKNLSEKKNGLLTSYYYNYNFYPKEISNLKTKEGGEGSNECPTLFLTEKIYTTASPEMWISFNEYTYNFYSDSWIRQEKEGGSCLDNQTSLCLSGLLGVYDNFYELTLSNSEVNKDNINVSKCVPYEQKIGEIEDFYSKYKSCNNNCNLYIRDAEKIIYDIKDYCSKALSSRDIYIKTSTGESMKDPCVGNCLTFEKKINDLKVNYGIDNGTDDGECGLSNVLLIWILNIVKWVKYIIPVIVILMGILDFIRAVATDKDDGMKKAQGRFVKRLIAAALIFVVPFILEFILEKMGFSVEGCRVINFD